MEDGMLHLFKQRLNSDLYARFLIESKAEILGLLRALREERSQIVLHFSDNRYIASRVLEVWQQKDRVAFDFGPDAAANEALLAAGHAVAETCLRQVSIQFELNGLRRIELSDGPALETAVPDCMLRLQRREAFRVPTPTLRPITLFVPAQDHCPRDVHMRVIDISSGGIGTVCDTSVFEPQSGTVLDNCQLALPEVGLVIADIEIRHVDITTDALNRTQAQCGMRFLTLSPQMSAFVQRFVMKLEREWRMLR